MVSASLNKQMIAPFTEFGIFVLEFPVFLQAIDLGFGGATANKANDMLKAFFNRSDFKSRLLILLVMSFQIAFISSLPASNASSVPPSKIKVDSLTRNACYEWRDKFVSSQSNTDFLSPQGSESPLPPAFYATQARKVNCNQRHHFQVISIDSREKFLKAKSSSGTSMKYCQKRLAESKYTLLQNQKLNWSLMEISKLAKSYACFVTGKVSRKPGNQKVFFYEELFAPLSSQTELGDQK